MTLHEVKNLVTNFFASGVTRLILPDDFLKIVTVSEYPEFDLESVKLALETFIEAGLVKKFPLEEKEGKKIINKIGYVLEKPLQAYVQTVTINGNLAFLIANTVNAARGILGESEDVVLTTVNPLFICEYDINDLLLVTATLLNNKVSKK